MASITPYKDGWRAFVLIDGKRKSKTFRVKREANAWAAAEEKAEEERKALPESARHTVRDMLERYARDVVPAKRGADKEALRIAALLRDFPELANKPLAEVKTPDLVGWRDSRLTGFTNPRGEKVSKVTAATVLRDISWLSNAFSIARSEWHWLEHKPFEGLRAPGKVAPRDRRVLPAEVKRLCRRFGYVTGKAPETKRQAVALAFLVGLRSAMRAGEILSLGRHNLDLVKRVATVAHKTQHITGKPRTVPLTRHAVRLLRPVANREKCFDITSTYLEDTFRKTCKQMLIENLHFHDSRAEALTRLSRKVDVMTLAKISGHRDLSILQNTYYRETAEDIAARL